MIKTFVIGLDGGTFKLIEPWVKEGHLPTFEKLLKNSAHGILNSTIPSMTCPAIPVLITGKNSAKIAQLSWKSTSFNCGKYHGASSYCLGILAQKRNNT